VGSYGVIGSFEGEEASILNEDGKLSGLAGDEALQRSDVELVDE
jgi:hypothetical protein